MRKEILPYYMSDTELSGSPNKYFTVIHDESTCDSDWLEFSFEFPYSSQHPNVRITSEQLSKGKDEVSKFLNSLSLKINYPEKDEFRFHCKFNGVIAFHKNGDYIHFSEDGVDLDNPHVTWIPSMWEKDPTKVLSELLSCLYML